MNQGVYSKIDAGDDFVCGILKVSKQMRCWGESGQKFMNIGTVEEIGAGANHVCAIRMNGAVQCWGGSNISTSNKYKSVTSGDGFSCGIDLDGTEDCWPTTRLILSVESKISAGRDFVCGLDAESKIKCTIINGNISVSVPAGVFEDVSAGGVDSLCGRTITGAVSCSGFMSPNESSLFERISVGPKYGCGIKRDKTIECWGAVPGAAAAAFRL